MSPAPSPTAQLAASQQPLDGDRSSSRTRLAARAAAATVAAALVLTAALDLTAAPLPANASAAIRLTGTARTAGTAGTVRSARAAQSAMTGRGKLVSVTPLFTLADKSAVRAELKADGFDPASSHYGVRAFRLIYRTVSTTGRPTTASGFLALPIAGPHRLTLVSFTHGTEVYRGDAPSLQPHGFDPAPAYTYASAGFATAEPDYLGLGKGPGPEPWMNIPAETTAALDMLRATRAYLTRHGRALNHRVLVTGFSQGASAALGLGRVLQRGSDHWFRLGALAPISGAYDFRHAELPALVSGKLVQLNPDPQRGAKYEVLYGALTLVSFDRLHRIYRSTAAVFRQPYARTIDRLLDGDTPDAQIIKGTPATLGQLLTARGFALLRHPNRVFAAELRTADSVCMDWTPKAPLRLFYATRDEQAVNANTFGCQRGFAARGLHIPVIDLGTPMNQGSRHYGSNVAGTARIVRWFTQLTHEHSPSS